MWFCEFHLKSIPERTDGLFGISPYHWVHKLAYNLLDIGPIEYSASWLILKNVCHLKTMFDLKNIGPNSNKAFGRFQWQICKASQSVRHHKDCRVNSTYCRWTWVDSMKPIGRLNNVHLLNILKKVLLNINKGQYLTAYKWSVHQIKR